MFKQHTCCSCMVTPVVDVSGRAGVWGGGGVWRRGGIWRGGGVCGVGKSESLFKD